MNDDLISREALRNTILSGTYDTRSKILSAIGNAPAVEPERPKGKWIETSDFDEFYGKVYKCANCNKETLGCSCRNYCPNCGADMRKGDAE